MKIEFDANLDYQQQAIASVTAVFSGQEICKSGFTEAPFISRNQVLSLKSTNHNDSALGNQLILQDETLHANIREIQLKNGLAPSKSFDSKQGINLTVEMETGTGKTYVYLRTIFELNRLYGFNKFIIVVPSVAVKEGVIKSLQMTTEHFRQLYNNTPFESYLYQTGQKAKLNPITLRSFAENTELTILITTIHAFNRDDNVMNRVGTEKGPGGLPLINYLQQTNPIVIIDEPQSVDSTDISREAIASLNPMCTLRYSATHLEKHHMLYKLDSVDAYEQKLVKQIEVAGIEVQDNHNSAYIKLLSVNNKKTPISAKIEIDASLKGGSIKRKIVTVNSGTDLHGAKFSGGRDIYDGYIVDDIYCEPGNEYVSFTSKADILRLGQASGGIDSNELKRLQIRKTIDEHLEKEIRLRSQGIKVLSLFFIDKVSNYRWYDESGRAQKGKFAQMFEEELKKVLSKPKYSDLTQGQDLDQYVSSVHNGYFAVDKGKDTSGNEKLKDSSAGKKASAADESAYHLIMRDKEKLLSFESTLKFIFSHSALKEGWDNPNVFQICTLNETSSVMKKRQEIGRGLRICVNQQGQRVHGFEVNTLTVMANESYEEFAEQLQKEIEEEEGIKFGVVEPHLFASILVSLNTTDQEYLGVESSEKLWEELRTLGYIDTQGKIQDSLKLALSTGNLNLPEEFNEHNAQIVALLKKVSGSLHIKNHNDKQKISLNKSVLLSPEFKELWNRIKYKTSFRVDFDSSQLIDKCANEIRDNLQVGKARFIYRKAKTEIDRGGVHAEESEQGVASYESNSFDLPDLISYLVDQTKLTRGSIVSIISKSGRLSTFKLNPQKFIEQVSNIIKSQMRLFIVDGIKYQKIGDDQYYAQELFSDKELFGYLSKNMVESNKSVFNHVVYDSEVELKFAKSFELSEDVKVYAKLPDWFKIDTPLGGYNPDWAVLIEVDGKQKLYFVVETKSTMLSSALRPEEKARIDCGKEHFKALGLGVNFSVSTSFDSFNSVYMSAAN